MRNYAVAWRRPPRVYCDFRYLGVAQPTAGSVCVSQTSESYSCLTSGSVIGISILDAEQRALSDRFASKVSFGAYDDVRIADGAEHAPLLEGALGHITAVVVEIIPSGDHAIVLCDVTSAHAESDGTPLLYCRRTYHSLRCSI